MSPPTDEPAPERSETLRFDTATYRPAQRISLPGLMLVSAATFAGAVLIGGLVGFLHQWFYIVLIFPAGIGLLVGLCGVGGLRAGKFAHPLLAGFVGLIGGCLAMLAMHYFEYYQFLHVLDDDDRIVWHEGGLGFREFVDIRAQQGVTITRTGRKGGMNLGYTGSYIYWAVEVLIAAGLAAWMMYQGAGEPFCTQCHRWKEQRVLGRLGAPAMTTANAIADGELTRLAEHDFDNPVGRLQIRIAVCSQCGTNAPIDVQVQEVGQDKKGNEKLTELAHVTYPGEALPVLEALAKPQSPPPESGTPPA
jgi:hypothetical protein